MATGQNTDAEDIDSVTEERDTLRRVVARWLHAARRHGTGRLNPADMVAELFELDIDITNELAGAELICDACDDTEEDLT